MSKKANPTLIGLFLVAGAALIVAALLLFSSRSLFHPQHKQILYFDTSLQGLSPGAPVKYQGVTIGTVVEVLIRHNQASNDFAMPIVIAIDERLAQSKSDTALDISSKAKMELLIKKGFRGRLEAESLVTGVLYVGLEMIPDAPAPVFHQLTPEYHEIPTVPSQVQQFVNELRRIDIIGLAQKLETLLVRLDAGVSKLSIQDINANLTNILGSVKNLVSTPDITNSFASLRQTLDQARQVLNRIDGRVDPLADSLTNTLYDARETMAHLRVGLRNVSELLSPDAPLRPNLAQALDELRSASRALADLAEFLERNPNALLAGKKRPKDQP